MFELRRYTAADAEEWDRFVAESKNGTFLFMRQYMDYHNDRFSDCSLMAYESKRNGSKPQLMAVLPANISGNELRSHGGLTYGGLVMSREITVEQCIDIFQAINMFLHDECNVNHVVYKPTPWIYHSIPAEEDLYAICNTCHARLTAREISSTIRLNNRLKFAKLRHRCANKARRNGIETRESDDIETFWHILDNNLTSRYGVHPVHSIGELQLLKSRFPDNIRLYMAYIDSEALAGTLVFECGSVMHTQYISASPKGKELGALDLLFDVLINNRYADTEYIDFGKSTEDQGRYLNTNLIHQKEGFGGRGVCYDTYEWTIE